MNFWKSIFAKLKNNKEKDELENEISNQFRDWVKNSIKLIGGKEAGEMEYDELQKHLIQNGIPEKDAWEIIIFLPIAFCRRMLPDINWLPEYEDYYSKTKQIKRKFVDNKRYVIIEDETNNYWNGNAEKEVVLNIVGRSSEFDAINQLLKDGGKIEDVVLTRTCIIR